MSDAFITFTITTRHGRRGAAGLGKAWQGMARPGAAGTARPCGAWLGEAGRGAARHGRRGAARQAWPGLAGHGEARRGAARQGGARLGKAGTETNNYYYFDTTPTPSVLITGEPDMPTHCPFCGDRRIVTYACGLYRCHKCDRLFDDDPGEGGDYSSHNPGVRIEREERRAKRGKVIRRKKWGRPD